jgi:hypothetical protein
MWYDSSLNLYEATAGQVALGANEKIYVCNVHDIFPCSCLFKQDSKDAIGVDIDEEDIQQGRLGDCWLLSALAAIANKRPDFIKSLFKYHSPEGGYSGIMINRGIIWVDHNIPIVYDHETRQVSIIGPRLSKQNEYWTLLIEKAILKYFNTIACPMNIKRLNYYKRRQKGLPWNNKPHYSDLDGGHPKWVMQVVLGMQHIQQQHTSQYTDEQLLEIFTTTENTTSIACCCTATERDGMRVNDTMLDSGFVMGHAYSVLRVDKERQLIRVRNPWNRYECLKYDDGVDDGSFWVDLPMFKDRFPVFCVAHLSR